MQTIKSLGITVSEKIV